MNLKRNELKELIKEIIKIAIVERNMLTEVAPPDFGPDKKHAKAYNKVMQQYPKDTSKAYATMWKIHNKIKEGLIDEETYKILPEEAPVTNPNGVCSNCGAQYSIRNGDSQAEQPGKMMRARNIQNNPDVNETAYKVEGPSLKTSNDGIQDPKKLDCPKNC